MLVFKGLQKTTLIDFPGRVASTFFLPKCNFRCPFCYNKQLVFDKKTGFEMGEKEALAFLAERKSFLDGICITGGEPLLHKGLKPFLKKVKGLGFAAKLDTNGSNPAFLKQLLEQKLLDYVAMDIKSSKKGYEKAAGTKVDLTQIDKSISLLRQKAPGYEFRTTLVPKIHSREDIEGIGEWLKGSKRLFLQQFNPAVPLLAPKLCGKEPFSLKELEKFAKILKPSFGEVKVRGV